MHPEILPLLSADLPHLTDLQPTGWPDIAPHFEYYASSPLCFPIKVVLAHKIVGIGTSIVRDETAWLAHIIVHPAYRHKGLGSLITQHLMSSVQRMQKETIYLIATDLGYPIYQKLGFETETEYVFLKGNLLLSPYNSSFNIVPFDESHKERLLEMDKKVSGENRSTQLDEHLSKGYVYKTEKAMQGYYLPTWHEGLIIASTFEAGSELMKRRLQDHDTAALPANNKAGIQFLLDHHFEEIKKAKRMLFGKKRIWHPEQLYNRIAGSIG